MSRHRPRSRLLAFAIALPVLAMLLATTAIAAPSKPVSVDIKPQISNDIAIAADDVAKGTCVVFDVTLRNDTKTQQLGSANYTLDPALDYDNDGCNGSHGPDAERVGHVDRIGEHAHGGAPRPQRRARHHGPLQLPGHGALHCGHGSVTYRGFSVIAKQANNYSGQPGNNLTTSGDFDIQAVGLCQTFAANETASGSIGGSAANSNYTVQAVTAAAGTLILAKGVNSIDCDDYTEHTDTVTVDFTGTAQKILTFNFPNSTHEQKSAFRVCFASPDSGPIGAGTRSATRRRVAPGRLRRQPDPHEPAVHAAGEDPGPAVTIKAWLRPGDPPGKG